MKREKLSRILMVVLLLVGLFPTSMQAQTTNSEMKAVWISTIYNLDYPSVGAKNNPDQQKQEYIKILDQLQDIGINTVFVQIRPKADALYESAINPWSDILTGTQGKDPGYDPMRFMIEETHKRGMEFHAWLNPYRVTTSGTDVNALASNHPARLHPDWVIAYNNKLYYNPSLEAVQQHIVDTVTEIVQNYDVDGIHFDDYFYPSNYPLPAGEGRDGQVANQRRQDVNNMVQKVHSAIKKLDASVDFGISPIGIWKNQKSDPAGSLTDGGEGYYTVFADAKAWINNGWIDYIIPQIYWQIGHAKADYATLVDWWSNAVRGSGVKLYIGQGIYKDEIASTIDKNLALNQKYVEVKGNAYFSLRDLLANRQGVADSLKEYHLTQAPSVIYKKGTVNTNNLNVRTGPGTQYSVLTKLPQNTQVKVINTSGEWYQLLLTTGQTGYVAKQYITLSKDIRLIINNKQVEPLVAPVISNNTTLVPLRIISEELGGVVGWNSAQKRITIQKGGSTLELYIGSKEVYVNGMATTLLTAPIVTEGTTLVPIRFISEQLGAQVDWDGIEKIVSIK